MEPSVRSNTDEDAATRNRTVAQLSAVGVGGNVLLAVFKLVAGI